MHKPSKKQTIMEQSKVFYNNLINSVSLAPTLLNVSLTSNPFIKDRDSFKYLKYQLSQYNKRVDKQEIKDQYQILSYNCLHSMMSDLAQIDSKDNQLSVLQQLDNWFKEQLRLIKQRSAQGQVRHQITKTSRSLTRMPQEQHGQHNLQDQFQIPFYLMQQKLAPYRNNHRTLHKQEQSPQKIVSNYKRKVINIVNPPYQGKEQQVRPRVLYPVPPKYQPVKDQLIQQMIQGQAQNTTNDGQPIQVAQGQAPPGQQLNAEISQVQSVQPDMGGFGEEPQQPQQQEPPQDVPDKLKPKNPVFVHAISTEEQPKYKQSYLFYQGNDSQHQRSMEIRTVRKYHNDLRQQKEESMQIQMAHEWAKRKSKMAKDIQKRLEQMKFKASYTISNQPSSHEQKLSYADQLKYGFTTIVKPKSKIKQYDLSYNELPKIGKYALDEKTIRSDRLSSLRNKFAKILNLGEDQSREPTQSMCQVTERRHRGISQIMKNHSQQKERQSQLQQVSKLKERLSRAKVNINYTSLSRGLCIPENEESIDQGEMKFPSKDLPSNPNMIETKKKKKKK